MKLNKKISVLSIALASLLVLTGCHPKVAPVSKMDGKLSCTELQNEIKKVENVKAEIESSRGFCGRNVGLAILFWPGVVINEVTGDTAEKQADSKLVALQDLYATQCMRGDKKEGSGNA